VRNRHNRQAAPDERVAFCPAAQMVL